MLFFHSGLLSPLLSTTWISFFLSNSSIILNILFEHSFYFSFGFSIQIPLWSQILKLVTSIVEKDPVKVGHTPSQIKVYNFFFIKPVNVLIHCKFYKGKDFDPVWFHIQCIERIKKTIGTTGNSHG